MYPAVVNAEQVGDRTRSGKAISAISEIIGGTRGNAAIWWVPLMYEAVTIRWVQSAAFKRFSQPFVLVRQER